MSDEPICEFRKRRRSTYSFGALEKKTNKFIFPEEAVKNKLFRLYQCIECGEDLVFKSGTQVCPYFSHYPNASRKHCSFYDHNFSNESQLHKEAKYRLKRWYLEQVKFIIPCCSCSSSWCIQQLSNSEEAIVEYSKLSEGYIADVAILHNNHIKYIFEVKNKHATLTDVRPEPWFEFDAHEICEIPFNQKEIPLENLRELECLDCIVKTNPWLRFAEDVLENRDNSCILCDSYIVNTILLDGKKKKICLNCVLKKNETSQKLVLERIQKQVVDIFYELFQKHTIRIECKCTCFTTYIILFSSSISSLIATSNSTNFKISNGHNEYAILLSWHKCDTEEAEIVFLFDDILQEKKRLSSTSTTVTLRDHSSYQLLCNTCCRIEHSELIDYLPRVDKNDRLPCLQCNSSSNKYIFKGVYRQVCRKCCDRNFEQVESMIEHVINSEWLKFIPDCNGEPCVGCPKCRHLLLNKRICASCLFSNNAQVQKAVKHNQEFQQLVRSFIRWIEIGKRVVVLSKCSHCKKHDIPLEIKYDAKQGTLITHDPKDFESVTVELSSNLKLIIHHLRLLNYDSSYCHIDYEGIRWNKSMVEPIKLYNMNQNGITDHFCSDCASIESRYPWLTFIKIGAKQTGSCLLCKSSTLLQQDNTIFCICKKCFAEKSSIADEKIQKYILWLTGRVDTISQKKPCKYCQKTFGEYNPVKQLNGTTLCLCKECMFSFVYQERTRYEKEQELIRKKQEHMKFIEQFSGYQQEKETHQSTVAIAVPKLTLKAAENLQSSAPSKKVLKETQESAPSIPEMQRMVWVTKIPVWKADDQECLFCKLNGVPFQELDGKTYLVCKPCIQNSEQEVRKWIENHYAAWILKIPTFNDHKECICCHVAEIEPIHVSGSVRRALCSRCLFFKFDELAKKYSTPSQNETSKNKKRKHSKLK